jgi:RNA polymerase sigma-70 factor (ECF subfamily)
VNAPDDDTRLVRAAQDGDRRAMETLLRRHHHRVLVVTTRICRDRGDAEDAAQNALVSIVGNLAAFDQRCTFSTWVHRIATNAALDELRRRSRRPLPDDGPTSEPAAAAGAEPDELVLGSLERARLAAALDRLPPEFRDAVLLRDVADLDYTQIAAVLDVPIGTVRSRIARGRARLAELLDPDRPDPGNPTPGPDVHVVDP